MTSSDQSRAEQSVQCLHSTDQIARPWASHSTCCCCFFALQTTSPVRRVRLRLRTPLPSSTPARPRPLAGANFFAAGEYFMSASIAAVSVQSAPRRRQRSRLPPRPQLLPATANCYLISLNSPAFFTSRLRQRVQNTPTRIVLPNLHSTPAPSDE